MKAEPKGDIMTKTRLFFLSPAFLPVWIIQSRLRPTSALLEHWAAQRLLLQLQQGLPEPAAQPSPLNVALMQPPTWQQRAPLWLLPMHLHCLYPVPGSICTFRILHKGCSHRRFHICSCTDSGPVEDLACDALAAGAAVLEQQDQGPARLSQGVQRGRDPMRRA